METTLRAVYLFLYVKDIATSRRFYEEVLGLPVLEEEARAVKYDAGEIILALNIAADFGVVLGDEPNKSQLIVFHVGHIDSTRAALEAKGIAFTGPTERYEIGATATFYDPDGHCLLLYELSEESLTWPSADKIREVLAGDSREHTLLRVLDQHKRASDTDGDPPILGRNKVLYIFNFVTDYQAAKDFYGTTLGLRILEEDTDVGVVKYDAGGILLATHLVETQTNAPRAEHLSVPRSSALVLWTPDIRTQYRTLEAAGLAFDTGLSDGEIGTIARFHDPNGHGFYLYEPSPAALSWPSGTKILRLAGQSGVR